MPQVQKKRADYWLSERDATLIAPHEDDDEPYDDGLYWNRAEDGGLVAFSDDDIMEEELDYDDDDDDDMMLDKPQRLMSEDIAGQMEI
jgi:AP-1 complex subunit sigma 1/2